MAEGVNWSPVKDDIVPNMGIDSPSKLVGRLDYNQCHTQEPYK